MSSPFSRRRETILVPSEEAGERLDLFLTRTLDGVSRKTVKRALDGGQVFVNGRAERRASLVLCGGDQIQVSFEGRAPSLPPVLSELYRDAHLLAVNKPAGLPCHATGDGGANALDLVAARLHEESGDAAPPILLHRLDVDTTGVLLFALDPGANRALARQFAEREVSKVYLALVAGSPPESFSVANQLKLGRRGRIQAVTSGGQTAETSFATLARGDGFALVEARPRTGRTHQIRVHLSDAGFPLLGDLLYGGPSTLKVQGEILLAGRHLLHARTLSLRRPDGAPLTLSAPLPDDFLPFCRTLSPPVLL
ncbi:pseudouridine synthase, RluA family [Desulfuromonas soudanensis]|uniref:Pseudouridine synthase n=1 Tax=Desulfuromonas soudanensis TaxID=1603606 RepID=A0A0M4DIZ5_9BACT|nr:RluA family pseudouridine synthase [Desulfuromonas soudanensis]ALC16970.1 pseudouridine synthase, RluA family [Desulfuromonas soudanensis]